MKFSKKLVNFSLLLFSFLTPLHATAYDEEPLDQRLVRGVEACQQNNAHAMQEFANPGDVALLASFFRANEGYQLPGIHFGVYLHSQNLLALRQQLFSALIGEILQRQHQLVVHEAPGVSLANPYKAAADELLSLREKALEVASASAARDLAKVLKTLMEIIRGQHQLVVQEAPGVWQSNPYRAAIEEMVALGKKAQWIAGASSISDLGVHLTTLAQDAAHLLYDHNQRSISAEFGDPLPKRFFDGYVAAVMTLLDLLESRYQIDADDSHADRRWLPIVVLDRSFDISLETARRDLVNGMLEPLLASHHRHRTAEIVDHLVIKAQTDPETLRLDFDLVASRSPLPQVRQLAYLMSAMLETYESLFVLRHGAEALHSPEVVVAEVPVQYRVLFEEIATGKLKVEPQSREAVLLQLIQRMRHRNIWLGTDEGTTSNRQRLISEVWEQNEMERLAHEEREKFGVSTLRDSPKAIVAAIPTGFTDRRQVFFLTLMAPEEIGFEAAKPIGVHEVIRLTAAGRSLLDAPLASLLIDRGDGTFGVRPEQVGATFVRLRTEMAARAKGRLSGVRAAH